MSYVAAAREESCASVEEAVELVYLQSFLAKNVVPLGSTFIRLTRNSSHVCVETA